MKVLLIAFPLLQVGELTVARVFGEHMVSGPPMEPFMDHESEINYHPVNDRVILVGGPADGMGGTS